MSMDLSCGPDQELEGLPSDGTQGGKGVEGHGATNYQECVADDVKTGKWTSFPQAVKLKEGRE